MAAASASRADEPGVLFVQVQCGSPPAIAPTSHQIELRGQFSPDLASPRWLTPLAGRVSAAWVDGRPIQIEEAEIDDGFLATRDLGKIFLTTSEDAAGYRAVVPHDGLQRLESTSP